MAGEKDFGLSDQNGYFKLLLLSEKTELPKLAEFVVAQEIRVYVDGKEYPIWAKAKRVKQCYGEVDGRSINSHCELTNELDVVKACKATLIPSFGWEQRGKFTNSRNYHSLSRILLRQHLTDSAH